MAMKSRDLIQQELKQKLMDAMDSEDQEALAKAFVDFAENLQGEILEDVKAYQATEDTEILRKRGVRQLTTKETKFYEGLIQAYRTGSLEKAFEGAENAFPESVIDTVLEDIKSSFPLLAAINLQNTSTVTKMIVNKKGVQLAVWGPLGSKITQELDGAIGKIDMTLNKLTAFMAVSKDMLEAGPVWMDAYVRAVLVEANGAGLCKGIVAGTGKDQPIGMLKDVSDDAAVVGGEYPDKQTIAIDDLSPKTFGAIAKTIAQGPNGRSRAVPELLMVVNPVDYFDKVMPATTFLTPNGTYINNVLPYPTKIVTDDNVPQGKIIMGLASRYFAGVGKGGSGGKIEYSDEVRFLDDERVYITKTYANGRPLDNNAFVVGDISNLAPANYEVVVRQGDGAAAAGTRDKKDVTA